MRAEPERYRSGHNGADSKSDGRVKPARGFESHPLRHAVTYRCERESPSQDIFRAAAAARGWETTAVLRSVPSEARDERPSGREQSHPLRHAVTYRCERESPSQDIFRAAAAARGWETTALHYRLAAASTPHGRPRRTPRRTCAADVPPASR